ncbi:MAG: recombinase family protein [Minisyncoccia bacterium]
MKEIDLVGIKFKAYNRKSSEQEERQALSIESQIERNRKLANEYGVKMDLEDFICESKSAKKSGTRPGFEQLIKEIDKGRVQGIITWHPDRLSRNAGDAGRLVDLIDEGKLKFIITNQQLFKNNPSDKFFITSLCSQAKMENDNKGENVKRGLVKKRRMGYLPGIAKIGYLNDKGEKGYRKTIKDPDRFYLVKEVFEMFLSGRYGVRELHRIAVEKIGLTSVSRKRMGGKAIKLSIFYNMLKDPFYAGFFFGKDEDGEITKFNVSSEVPRIITEQQHRKIVSMISSNGSVRTWIYVNEFPYKRFMKCGDCGGSVTAEKKIQMICEICKNKFSLTNKNECPKCKTSLSKLENSKILHYVYYHCTKKKDLNCPGGGVTEVFIDNQVKTEIVSKMAMSKSLKDWCINSIVMLEQKEEKTEKTINESWYKKLTDLEKQLTRLGDSYVKGIFEETEFLQRKAKIEDEMADIKARIGLGSDYKATQEALEDKLEVLTEIRDIIENGSYNEKIEAFSILGSNLTLKDRKVSVTKDILYNTIQKGFLEAKSKNPQFEPENILDISERNEVFEDVRPTLLRR